MAVWFTCVGVGSDDGVSVPQAAIKDSVAASAGTKRMVELRLNENITTPGRYHYRLTGRRL